MTYPEKGKIMLQGRVEKMSWQEVVEAKDAAEQVPKHLQIYLSLIVDLNFAIYRIAKQAYYIISVSAKLLIKQICHLINKKNLKRFANSKKT